MPSQRKSALITGCSAGGIGAALAEAFHEKGYHVFATARTPSKISHTLSTAANVTILTLDVLSSDSIAAAVKSVEQETGGRLDVLVNNSGAPFFSPGLDASIEDGKKLFDLNFWAPLAMLQAFGPFLINAKGCLVNNCSCNAYLPIPFCSLYGASKAALIIAGETWGRELKPFGVRTISISTCATKTNAFADFHVTELPETSPYFEVRQLMYDLADGRLQANAMDARQFATKVVREVDKGTIGIIWVGQDSFMARMAASLAPRPVLDMILETVTPFGAEMTKVVKEKKDA